MWHAAFPLFPSALLAAPPCPAGRGRDQPTGRKERRTRLDAHRRPTQPASEPRPGPVIRRTRTGRGRRRGICRPAASWSPASTRERTRLTRSAGRLTVGSSSATTARYIATAVRAAARAAAPSVSTTVTAPRTTPTEFAARPAASAPGRIRSCATATMAGFALPPTLISAAIRPASAAPRGPHAPSRRGGSGRWTGYRSVVPGARRNTLPSKPSGRPASRS